MAECRFESVGIDTIRCNVCGTSRRHVGDPSDYHRKCGSPYRDLPDREATEQPKPDLRFTTPCVHRGEVLERGTCTACGFRGTPFEVFACEVHGKCMVRRYRNDRPDLRVCTNCDDFAPA